jgi:hypothetical protein
LFNAFNGTDKSVPLYEAITAIMNSQPPALIAIDLDDYHAEYVGHTSDGRQFFVTTPFIAAVNNEPGREYLAVFLFDQAGRFLEARIDDLGTRKELDRDLARDLLAKRLEELGGLEYGRIEVQPFKIERFGTTFGLVPRPPEDDDDGGCWVELLPGNYMAFHEPWDSGEYDT